jgi:hypothetical protein
MTASLPSAGRAVADAETVDIRNGCPSRRPAAILKAGGVAAGA